MSLGNVKQMPCSEENTAMEAVYRWNCAFEGKPTQVLFEADGEIIRSRTDGHAIAINGVPMVTVIDSPTPVPITDLMQPIFRWVRIHRKRKMSHWVAGFWKDEDAFIASIYDQQARDDSITRIEISKTQSEADQCFEVGSH